MAWLSYKVRGKIRLIITVIQLIRGVHQSVVVHCLSVYHSWILATPRLGMSHPQPRKVTKGIFIKCPFPLFIFCALIINLLLSLHRNIFRGHSLFPPRATTFSGHIAQPASIDRDRRFPFARTNVSDSHVVHDNRVRVHQQKKHQKFKDNQFFTRFANWYKNKTASDRSRNGSESVRFLDRPERGEVVKVHSCDLSPSVTVRFSWFAAMVTMTTTKELTTNPKIEDNH